MQPGTYIGANNTNINVNRSVTIIGNGSRDTVIINAQSLARMFNIASNGSLSLINITLSNGKATGTGGAITSTGNLTANNCIFSNNNASGSGGAIYSSGAGVAINNSIFNSNVGGGGGAIYASIINNVSQFIVNNTNFSNNGVIDVFSHYGGAIQLRARNTISIIANSNFTSNKAGYGATLSNEITDAPGNGNLTIENSNFNNNIATKEGGAMYSSLAPPFGGSIPYNIVINSSNFTKNTAIERGGALSFDAVGFRGGDQFSGNISAIGSNFKDNSVTNLTNAFGGAINFNAIEDSHLSIFKIDTSNFTNNSAAGFGGAIRYFVDNRATINVGGLNITSSAFNINNAPQGGAIFSQGNFNASYTIFLNNTNGVNSVYLNNSAGLNISANHNWWGDNNPTGETNIGLVDYYGMFLNSTQNNTNLTLGNPFNYGYYFVLNGTTNNDNGATLFYLLTQLYVFLVDLH